MYNENQKSGSSSPDLKKLDKAFKNYYSNLKKEEKNLLEEPSVGYSSFLQNKMLLIKMIRVGLGIDLYEAIKAFTPFDENDWANFLNVSVKTLQRNKREKDFHFKPIHSEKILEVAEVAHLGNQVFGDPDKFALWLKSTSIALGNMTPAELLKDSYGKELVMEELNRIEHGIFA